MATADNFGNTVVGVAVTPELTPLPAVFPILVLSLDRAGWQTTGRWRRIFPNMTLCGGVQTHSNIEVLLDGWTRRYQGH
jgi:hypothetical protein